MHLNGFWKPNWRLPIYRPIPKDRRRQFFYCSGSTCQAEFRIIEYDRDKLSLHFLQGLREKQMRVIETSPNRLVAMEQHRASRIIAIVLALLITAIGIYQATLGNILVGVALTIIAIIGSYGLCRALGPVQAIFDRVSGTLSVERQCFYGNRSESLALNDITAVDIADRETDDRRPQHIIVKKGENAVSLTGPYSNSATHEGVVSQINAWLDSDPSKA